MNTSSVVAISDKSWRQSGVRWFVALLAAAAFCSLSHARQLDIETYVSEWMDDSRTEMRLRPASRDDLTPALVTTNYDNWSPQSFGGITIPRDRVRTGADEIGDDLNLVNNTGGVVSGIGWSYVNLNQSDFLTRFRLTFRWYESDAQTLIRQFSFIVNTSRRPNSAALVIGEPGFWDFLNLSVPDSFWFSMSFSEAQGIPVEDMGVLNAGPRTLGYSSELYRNFTTNTTLSFGSDQVNLALLFGTRVIPAPWSVMLPIGVVAWSAAGMSRSRGGVARKSR